MLTFRSVCAAVLASTVIGVGDVTAQVLLCPTQPDMNVDGSRTSIQAETMLERLLITLDLHDAEGLDQAAIMRAHNETPGALLAKLGNVVDRCHLAAAGGVDSFDESLPDLRRYFFKVMSLDSGGSQAADVDVAEIEQTIDLSVRGLWRKLWFRTSADIADANSRWAVIVASPADADAGWDRLSEHRQAWEDVHFELHVPYYSSNKHHAIVVGKKLPLVDAEKLLDYVKEMGMAEDSFIWPLPVDQELEVAAPKVNVADVEPAGNSKKLDLRIIDQ